MLCLSCLNYVAEDLFLNHWLIEQNNSQKKKKKNSLELGHVFYLSYRSSLLLLTKFCVQICNWIRFSCIFCSHLQCSWDQIMQYGQSIDDSETTRFIFLVFLVCTNLFLLKLIIWKHMTVNNLLHILTAIAFPKPFQR